ncbi:Uncharacterised protein [Leclercia adecarboxylata]|uniref:Uncharacterized protein n=1 Tax=Leclercia adecarboxylata TaxID=83655 RepID=A0A4U9HXA8_9ENTR|nr:Uncharacterised protein [Leclercia adecarboxylata]
MMQKKRLQKEPFRCSLVSTLAVLMLIATAALVVVAHPPVFVADLLVTADASTRKPQYGPQENAQDRAMRKVLRQVKLRQLV